MFKYTLSGSSLGSWTIDAADAHPTGITLDPTGVSDIWIVDNGTDKVYQYAGADRPHLRQPTRPATFALAAGNTNPQGIADPPVLGNAPAPAQHSLTYPRPSVEGVSFSIDRECWLACRIHV